MPYKSDKITIKGTMYDRRRKLTDDQKSQIKGLFKDTGVSIHSLAKKYGVSRRTIQFIVYPEREQRAKNRFREKWKDYADRKKLTEATRKLRHYKHDLLKQGKIEEEAKNGD